MIMKNQTKVSTTKSLEEMAKEFVKQVSQFEGDDAVHFNPLLEKSFKAGAEWAKKNNY